MFSGVYFTEDQIVRYADHCVQSQEESRLSKLERENQRLREELQRIKHNEDTKS
jgi:cell shape-determining protein MreC